MKIRNFEILPKEKESLGILDSFKETNRLKDFLITYFKDKIIVSSLDGRIKVLNNIEAKEDLIQYGYYPI